MFRVVGSKRCLVGASTVAAGTAAWITINKGYVTTSCTASSITDECARCNLDDNGSSIRCHRILIVGSGLTGSLTAFRIRQRLQQLQTTQKLHENRGTKKEKNERQHDLPVVDLTMVERASYPAGRFGATATYQGCVADLGAQVLSTINSKDHRAQGGHGVTVENIRTADDVVAKLKSGGLLSRADDNMLGETEERMLWEGLWEHYFPLFGMNSIMEKILEWANVRPRYCVRIDSVTIEDADKVRVQGVERRQQRNQEVNEVVFENCYDCVILCIPAPDILQLNALGLLPKDARNVLEKVVYDQRTCEAHFFSAKLAPQLAKAFGDKVELMLDDDVGGCVGKSIQYISWQNRKRHNPSTSWSVDGTDLSSSCALVVHGQPRQLQPLGEYLDLALSDLTGLSSTDIASFRLHSKSISWQTSQMIMPMEAVVSDPPILPPWQCIKGQEGKIIIAGDFMTQSSFVGCVASADAAAQAVVERIMRMK